jgi:hypothetical protein
VVSGIDGLSKCKELLLKTYNASINERLKTRSLLGCHTIDGPPYSKLQVEKYVRPKED